MSNVRNLAYDAIVGFQSQKAAQIAAFFVSESGGKIDKLKLAKLQYLAEREFLARHGRPMVYDELYSLPHGPICSSSLNGIEGKLGDRPEWQAVRANGVKDIHGKKNVLREDLDEISDAEFEVLRTIVRKFGGKTATELRSYTHNKNNCPEYTEVTNARVPISYERILRELGNPSASELAKQIEDIRKLEIAFTQ